MRQTFRCFFFRVLAGSPVLWTANEPAAGCFTATWRGKVFLRTSQLFPGLALCIGRTTSLPWARLAMLPERPALSLFFFFFFFTTPQTKGDPLGQHVPQPLASLFREEGGFSLIIFWQSCRRANFLCLFMICPRARFLFGLGRSRISRKKIVRPDWSVI